MDNKTTISTITKQQRDAKKDRLSKALRANLQRRKAGVAAKKDDTCPSS